MLGLPFAAFSSFLLDVTPSHAAFKSLTIEALTPCDFTLTRLEQIPYQCWRFKDRDAKLPVWEDSIGFSFGQLEPFQWEQIAQAYGNPNAIAPYNRDHHYWLMDFMPPLMQAINRHRFERESITTLEQKSISQSSTTIVTNCWGTLYELLRLRNQPASSDSFLMMVDPNQMLTTLTSISVPVETPQPGDFLLITHQHREEQQIYLDHVALYVDDHILFEKAGVGDAVPYRLIDNQTLEKIWRPDVFDHQIRRPIPNPNIPHPLTFSQSQPLDQRTHHQTALTHTTGKTENTAFYPIFPLPSLLESNGRFFLPKAAYTSEYYQEHFQRVGKPKEVFKP